MDKRPIAEILARAYDREEAAQMGEPDPWKDIEPDILVPDAEFVQDRIGCAEAAIEALAAAGYRIVLAEGKD